MRIRGGADTSEFVARNHDTLEFQNVSNTGELNAAPIDFTIINFGESSLYDVVKITPVSKLIDDGKVIFNFDVIANKKQAEKSVEKKLKINYYYAYIYIEKEIFKNFDSLGLTGSGNSGRDATNPTNITNVVNNMKVVVPGIASAMAMASLPQGNPSGTSFSASVGSYKGKQAIAIGITGDSIRGTVPVKIKGTIINDVFYPDPNTRWDFGNGKDSNESKEKEKGSEEETPKPRGRRSIAPVFGYGDTDRLKGVKFYSEDFTLPKSNEEIKDKIIKRIEANEKNNPVSVPLVYDPTINSEIVSNSGNFIERLGEGNELVLNVWMRRADNLVTKKSVETSEIGVNTDITMSDIERMENELAKLRKEVDSLNALVERLRAEKVDISADKEKIIAHLTKEVERLERELQTTPNIADLREELENTKRELEKVKEELQAQLSTNASLTSELERLRNEILRLEKEVANKEGIIGEKDKQTERLTADINNLTLEKNALASDVKAKDIEIATLKEKLKQLQEKLESLKNEKSAIDRELLAKQKELK